MTYKTTAAFALALTLVTCSAAPVVAGDKERVCEGMAGIALSGAELGLTMELIDPAIDVIVENSLTLEDAAPLVSVLASGYARGVMGEDPSTVGMSVYANCMSIDA